MPSDKDISVPAIRSNVVAEPARPGAPWDKPIDKKTVIYLMTVMGSDPNAVKVKKTAKKSIDDTDTKAQYRYYLCTRLDKSVNHVEVVAQVYDFDPTDDMQKRINLLDRTKQTEMFVPWNRIDTIVNLTYKKQ